MKSLTQIAVFSFLFLLTLGHASADPGSRFNSLLDETDKVRGQNNETEPEPEPEPEPAACGEEGKKEFVRLVADQYYLWYRELAPVSPNNYATAQAYLDALTAPLAADRRDPGFSYLTTKAADDARGATGAYVGFGFRYRCDNTACFFFSDVLQESPAGDAGFIRGDEVIAIDTGNGYETISELANRNVSTLELFGPSEAGVSRGFRVRKRTGEIVEADLVKRELDTPPLAVDPILLNREGLSPVGYLNLRSFITSANDALDDAVSYFRDNNVTDLVIDLRYNGGGYLSVADRMLDLLGGLVAEGERSFWISHNDKQTDLDQGAIFGPLPQSMSPIRIAFITTGGTASASELVINGLSPYIEVVLIGEDTLGKAVGQYAFDQNQLSAYAECDTRLRLVAFEIVNGEGDGGYYTGLVDSGRFTLCPAEDDVTRNWGDPLEASLTTALGWLNQGICSATTSAQRREVPFQRRLIPSDWNLMKLPDAPFGRSPFIQ
jgi:carboxyl-terminal processing protease